VLGREPGVITYELDLDSDAVRVVYDPRRITVTQIVAALTEAGYPPGSVVER
jgi:copper chaperone CopZ